MPAVSPIPVRRSHNLTVRRVLLALVVGLVAWWSTSRWLEPKSQYSLRFQNQVQSGSGWSFLAKPVDRDERFLLVQRPGFPDAEQVTTHVYELSSGRSLATHTESFADRLASPFDFSPWSPHQPVSYKADGEG